MPYSTNHKTIFIFTIWTVFASLTGFAQTVTNTVYEGWWTNKEHSIFESVNSGTFSGTTTGYIQLSNAQDTLLLDFQSTATGLTIQKIEEPVYDDNRKIYSTQTTSGKTKLFYETFMMANIMTLVLNGTHYGIGTFDGAADMPIPGLSFNYSHENNTEYLTLFVTRPLRLTTTVYLFNKGVPYPEAKKNEKAITVLPGSTLIVTIKK